MEICFILVNPAVPENIGFSLRAMKTMGFSKLRIVGNPDLNADGMRKTAYASHDLIEEIRVFDSLIDALSDVDLAIGTTAKQRTSRNEVIPASELRKFISGKASSVNKVAVVFGSEENGLHKDEINLCHAVSTIPLQTTYPSLNLSQSVMIYAYELAGSDSPNTKDSEVESLFPVLMSKGEEVIKWLELDRNPVLYQKMKDRLALADDTDIGMLLTVLGKLKRKMKSEDL